MIRKRRADKAARDRRTPEQMEQQRNVNRQWSRNNRARTRIAAAKHRLANPTYYPDYQRQWRKGDRSRAVVYNAQRRALTASALGDGITRDQWLELLAEYADRCGYCARVRKLTLDHVDPLSKGGAHDIFNAVQACKTCNSSKGHRPLLVWLAARRAA